MPDIETAYPAELAKVACAIICCDEKPTYKMAKGKPKRWKKRCQRLGSRKHSCVFHTLKKQENHIKSGPQFDFTNDPSVGRVLKPDVMIGDEIYDAKFPCDPDGMAKAWQPGGAGKAGTVKYSSPSGVGDYGGKKEEVDYKKINGNEAQPMTPETAKEQAPAGGCDCTNMAKTAQMV
jgi:hypothetical protein